MDFELLIPLVAVAAPFAVAIIAMMTKHQQKMAELYHRHAQTVDPRIDQLQSEVRELKELIHQQTIALDRIASPMPSGEIRERIGT